MSSSAASVSFDADVKFLHFKDSSRRAAFDAFRLNGVSTTVFSVMLCVATLIQIISVAVALQSSNFVILPLRYLRLILMTPIWLYLYQVKYYKIPSTLAHRYLSRTRLVGDISACCCILSLAITLLGKCYIGPCTLNDNRSNCNHEGLINEMPQDAVISLILSLIGIQTLMKPRWQALLLCWGITTASIIAASMLVHAKFSPTVPLIGILTFLILYEYECNVLRTYIAMINMEQSIRSSVQRETDSRVTEMRTVEMRNLLGNVAHDLKTPMQSFVMDLEYLRDKLLTALEKSDSRVIYSAADAKTMSETVQNLLDTNHFMYMVINRAIDFTKCASGFSLKPCLLTIDLLSTIEWAVNMCRSKSNVDLQIEGLPDGVCSHIITDKQWLIENILCLVSNATKFTMHGSVVVRCSLDSTNEPDMLLVEVEDTGIGIAEDKRSMMFQPFQQAMHMAGGTGLGLYSMSLRMEALGGECGLHDRKDGKQGCCFWFKIPYRADPSDIASDYVFTSRSIDSGTSSIDDSLSQADAGDEAFEPLHSVLVVDDSLTIRKTITRVLVNEGLSVDLAENGQMALEMMATQHYDLVLMDLQMPVMDGLEATRRLRQLERDTNSPHQKILGISAYAGDPYSCKALDAGMDGFIEKPFSLQHFLDTCKEHKLSKNAPRKE